MKALLINGSPHPRGCTYTALSEVAGALEKNGVETEIIQIGVKPVQGCIDCGKCADTHRCVFDDAVNVVLDKLENAQALVIGSPVYYASPNGSLLSLLDRLFFTGFPFAGKIGAAVVSARRAGTTAALDVLNKYFLISGMPIAPSQYWNMVHGFTPEDVRQDLEGLQTLRHLGENIAWLVKAARAADEAGVPRPVRENPRAWTHFIR